MTRHSRWTPPVAAVAGIIAAFGLAGTVPVAADDTTRTASTTTVAKPRTASAIAPVRLPGQGLRTYTDAEVRTFERTGGDPAVLRFWTKERMKAATPLDMPGDAQAVRETARAVARQLPGKAARPVASRFSAARDLNKVPVTNFSVTNGKLFIGGYESGSWCSASAVNTPSKRVLFTAGHCVHSGRGGDWLANLVFVPRYNSRNADPDPVGRFQAYRLRTFNSWINDSNLNRDVGWVTTFSGGDWGARVVDTVGGHGMAYNGGTEFDVSIFGYPSNRDNGRRMWACWGTAKDSSIFDDRSKIGCDFGPGSSGGPWLWQYSNTTGQGYVRSVMSTVDGAGVNRGPYFDTAVRDGLDAADGDW